MFIGVVGVTLAVSGSLFAAAPDEAVVQGLYEGTCTDASGNSTLEARVVAQGNGTYKVLARRDAAKKNITKIELSGKTEGEAVTFSGKAGDVEWKGSYASGSITGSIGEGNKFSLKRVERLSPSIGKKPPKGAVVLLDGKSLDEVTKVNKTDWSAEEKTFGEDGSIQVPKSGMNSKRQFEGSFDLHVEFKCPLRSSAHSQGRGNSGVFLPSGDEIQVLDSFGEATYTGGGCGGFYKYKNPDTMEIIDSLGDKPDNKYNLSSAPPLQWQTYDVEYRVQKKDGKYAGKPRVTVYHNGIKIHDNVEIGRVAKSGNFHFQDHGNPVRYRNIWVVPVEEK